jgi:hypothetical protein
MECEYFRSFRYFEPDIQSGSVTHDDTPDFRAEVGDRVVGIEISRLFKPTGRQDVESTQDRILDEVCRMAQEQGLPIAHVTLFFNLQRTLDGAARSRIAHGAVRVIAEQMPAEGESVELESVRGQPREVDLITVNRVHCHWPGRWTWLEAGTIEREPARLVQEAIDRKARKLPSYLELCSECWLVLVADSFRVSGKLAFDESSQAQVFSSPFARTYLLDFGRGRLHRLRTS